jgi:Flp pilus assembly protein TadD
MISGLGGWQPAIGEAARINPTVLQRTKLERLVADMGVDEEVRKYRAELAGRPGTAPEYYRLGNGLALVGRYPEALAAFQKATRLDPGNADILNDLGSTLAMLGRWQEAETAFREALRLRPEFPAAQRNLERALERQRTP